MGEINNSQRFRVLILFGILSLIFIFNFVYNIGFSQNKINDLPTNSLDQDLSDEEQIIVTEEQIKIKEGIE